MDNNLNSHKEPNLWEAPLVMSNLYNNRKELSGLLCLGPLRWLAGNFFSEEGEKLDCLKEAEGKRDVMPI